MDGASPSIFFIADLHLDYHEQERIDCFVSFLRWVGSQGGTLYILGDLFNFWLGQAQVWLGPFRRVTKEMQYLSRSDRLFFLHGNRDFLYSPCWQKRGGRTVADGTILHLPAMATILYHGDVFLTGDKSYLHYRQVVQRKWVYLLTSLLPASACLHIGKKMRCMSQRVLQHKEAQSLQMDFNCMQKILQNRQADAMICGHHHQEIVMPVVISEKVATIYVLPENRNLHLRYLRWEKGQFNFENFTEGATTPLPKRSSKD
jgi:UDP-2,3-diacylglucosamine hydrolase